MDEKSPTTNTLFSDVPRIHRLNVGSTTFEGTPCQACHAFFVHTPAPAAKKRRWFLK